MGAYVRSILFEGLSYVLKPRMRYKGFVELS